MKSNIKLKEFNKIKSSEQKILYLKPATTIEQFSNIEKLYEISFPIEEKKPFWLIVFFNQKSFEVFSIEDENNNFIGLAIVIKYKNLILLDYFAIVPEVQGQNYGSKALQLIIEKYKNFSIIIEIEDTEIHSENRDERLRRKNFYLKNGLSILPFKVNLFGVQMELLANTENINFENYYDLYLNQFKGYRKEEISFNVKFIKIN